MDLTQFFRFFDAAPIPYQSLDSSGNIRYVNAAWCRVLGYSKEQVLGTSFANLLPEKNRALFPQYITAFFEGNKTEKDAQYRLRHRDGSWLSVRYNGSVLRDPEIPEPLTQCFFYETAVENRLNREKEYYKGRYRELFDNARDGMAIYKPLPSGEDFTFVDFNRAAETITRTNQEEVVGKRLLEVFPNMDKTPLLQALRDVAADGKPRDLEPFYYEDDRRRGYRRNRVFRLPSGEVVTSFSDVTQEEIGKTFLKTVFTLEDNFVCTTIRGEVIQECNNALLDFLGLASMEAFKRIHHCICDCFIRDDAKGYIGADMDGINWLDYVITHQRTQTVKTIMLSKEGVPHVFSLHASPVTYDDKDRYLVLFSDITLIEDFQAELLRRLDEKTTELRQNIDLLQKSEEITKSGSWRMDLHRNTLLFSEGLKRLFNTPPQMSEIAFDDLHLYIPEAAATEIKEAIATAKTSGHYYTKKSIFLPSGAERIIVGIGETQWDETGNPISIVGVSNDVTESDRTEQLERENERLQLHRYKLDSLHHMFSAIAHHWRQPLSVISLVADDLAAQLEELPLPEETKSSMAKDLRMLLEHARFLSQTINDFALFASGTIKPTRFNLQHAVAETHALYKAKLDDFDIEMTMDGEGWELDGDRYELMRILTSLLENAIEAIQKKRLSTPGFAGKISLRIAPQTLTLCDNGSGVLPEHRSKIFDPYFTTKFMGWARASGFPFTTTASASPKTSRPA